MRLALVISGLGPGGAERVLTRLAGHWAGAGWELTLVTLGPAGADFFTPPPTVRRVGLDLLGHSASPWAALSATARRLLALRRTITAARPEVVLSFGDRTNVLTLAALIGTGLPVVVSERNDPLAEWPGRLWHRLRHLLYPRAAALVSVSAEGADHFAAALPPDRNLVIGNPLDPPPTVTPTDRREPLLLALGRLAPQKDFPLLVQGFAAVAPRFPDWRLVILGQGPRRDDLLALADQLGVAGRVELPGPSDQVDAWLARAGALALTSRYEGFPNVLAEALAHGVPAVASDCSSAVRLLMTGPLAARIFPPGDAEALARHLEAVMADPGERARLAAAGRESAARFTLPAVAAQWETALRAAARGGRS